MTPAPDTKNERRSKDPPNSSSALLAENIPSLKICPPPRKVSCLRCNHHPQILSSGVLQASQSARKWVPHVSRFWRHGKATNPPLPEHRVIPSEARLGPHRATARNGVSGAEEPAFVFSGTLNPYDLGCAGVPESTAHRFFSAKDAP
jgi:hypothetical protein